MKKMKCESCGANLKIDEKGEYAYCSFCRAKYKLKEDLNVNLNLNMDDNMKGFIEKPMKYAKTGLKIYMIFFAIIFVVVLTIIVSTFVIIGEKVSGPSSFDISSHNSSLELYSGKQSKFFIESLLDNINTNNKTNDIIVTVKFDNKEYSESEDIIMLKQMLDNKSYEIDFEYNSKGFITVCNILDIY